jgi:hypothetical protein
MGTPSIVQQHGSDVQLGGIRVAHQKSFRRQFIGDSLRRLGISRLSCARDLLLTVRIRNWREVCGNRVTVTDKKDVRPHAAHISFQLRKGKTDVNSLYRLGSSRADGGSKQSRQIDRRPPSPAGAIAPQQVCEWTATAPTAIILVLD